MFFIYKHNVYKHNEGQISEQLSISEAYFHLFRIAWKLCSTQTLHNYNFWNEQTFCNLYYEL